MLNSQETKLVKDTLPALRQHGEHISTVFYKTMLRDHPDLHNYFNNVNMHTGKQPRALTSLILAFASNIVNISELTPKLERVAQKHASLNIQPEQYEIVGKYLLRAFSAVLGPSMTPDVKLAWTKAYWVMAKMLTGREAHIYREFEAWKAWRKFMIYDKKSETIGGSIVSFTLKPVDGKALPIFLPGQYITLRITVPGMKYAQLRQYSLSDAPSPDHYRITVKRDQGTNWDYLSPRDDMTVSSAASSASDSSIGSVQPCRPGIVSNSLIDEFHEGDTLELTHPSGAFHLNPNLDTSMPLVLISAGVCVAPLMSILNTVVEKRITRPLSWIQASRHDAPFQAHVEKIAKKHPNMRTKFFKSRLSDSDVLSYTSTFDNDFLSLTAEDLYLSNRMSEYYVCGPEKFMIQASNHLQRYGVHQDRVQFEIFSVGSFEMAHD
ncbi:globin-like protein [Annulohypoxylon maeteangense]|uniref:globin-like protein n=1 Tax=Annulohypoxylon maeteangense TaxID=1927788 RepID=UPI002007D27F|nr:globin-like protein [Annulohypoxylon maeteangense]KAI0886332.1 globin-like protein [Annulohypoxylon maeteangense]